MNSDKICLIPYSASGTKSEDEILLKPYTYMLQLAKKDIKIKLIETFNTWLNISDDKLYAISDIAQMIHNSSLLLDQYKPNDVFGFGFTINSVNYLIFIILEKIINLGHPEAFKIHTEQILEYCRGQSIQVYWRDNITCPSEADYKEIIKKSNDMLFMWAVRNMQLFSENKLDFTKLTDILGLYVQIREDYCNMRNQNFEIISCDDTLPKWKFNIPIIHAINSKLHDEQIMCILRKRTSDDNIKKYFVSLLEKCGSFKYTAEILKDLDKQAREEIQKLGGNPYMEKILDELLTWKEA